MTQRFRDEVTGHTNGTTVNMLPADGLQRPLLVRAASGGKGSLMTSCVTPMFDLVEERHLESNRLAAIRAVCGRSCCPATSGSWMTRRSRGCVMGHA